MSRRPIGIFDSGVGGLTVVKEVRKALPKEEIIYFGDTARVPYGVKSRETVTKFSRENVEFLLKFNVKLIIVACNTASSLSLPALSCSFNIPIIGVIGPGVEKASRITKRGPIGVIGTRSTISSGIYQKALKSACNGVKVMAAPCPLFVPLVEEGWLDNKVTSGVVRTYLNDFKEAGVETVILGCTHYPLLKKVIRRFLGTKVKLVDSASETAFAVKEMLKKEKLLNKKSSYRSERYFVSDEPAAFKKIGERFLGCRIRSIKKVSNHV